MVLQKHSRKTAWEPHKFIC